MYEQVFVHRIRVVLGPCHADCKPVVFEATQANYDEHDFATNYKVTALERQSGSVPTRYSKHCMEKPLSPCHNLTSNPTARARRTLHRSAVVSRNPL
jgi:hypothetical protein